MSLSLNIVLRLKLANRPGVLARVLEVMAAEGGNLGAIDLVAATPQHVVRDLMVRLASTESLERITGTLKQLPGVELLHVADRVYLRHLGGKIEVGLKAPLKNWEDLSLVYTPGVARIAKDVAQNPLSAYRLTMKGNFVAIVTDGSAVLGLGNLGPLGALPVMEGKAALFKQFAGIDAVPLCLNVHEPEEIVRVVAAVSPAFGGINLEDIAAPKCFEVEERLRELLDIPVFHDDQHGTAIVTLAALLNALKVVGKDIRAAKVVISGAGAAGVAITKILLSAGARRIVVCDRKGAIARDNPPEEPHKRWLALNTNEECLHGSLKEVLAGADVFIGVSAPGLLTREDVMKMADNPVVFALANPDPEVEPEEVYGVVGVVATGRSDYPNQVNNALAFPGVFRGALNCHARTINEEMCLAAARALAGVIPDDQLNAENIIPSVFNREVVPAVAKAVEEAAIRTGVARKVLDLGKGGGPANSE